MSSIIIVAAVLFPRTPLVRKYTGIPIAAPTPIQMSCLLVRLKATLFFTLAATDPEKHLENLQKLSAMLENDMILECLFRAESEGDLLRIDNYMEKL